MFKKVMTGLATGLVALGVSVVDPKPAEAGATIHFGFGVGTPYYGGYYPYYAPPRPVYRPHKYRPRCWTEPRHVLKHNRYGEPYYVVRRVRVCH